MREARRWCARHWDEFNWYKNEAARLSADGYASPNFVLQSMRSRFRVSVPNAYAAPMARIAMEQRGDVRFRIAKSKVDGFTEAVL